MKKKNYGIILAAGRGSRMGREVNKVYLKMAGRPVLYWTIKAFLDCDAIDGIVIVLAPGEEELLKDEVLEHLISEKPIELVLGGGERQDSVLNGLKALEDCSLVAIHDGARPFIDPELIARSLAMAAERGSSVVGMPLKDTVKRIAGDGRVIETIDRSKHWLVQTPQSFKYDIILRAYEDACEKGFKATDDSSLLEFMGHEVYMIEGSYRNIKITTEEDLLVGEVFLRDWEGE